VLYGFGWIDTSDRVADRAITDPYGAGDRPGHQRTL
jgi:hypothetical protein